MGWSVKLSVFDADRVLLSSFSGRLKFRTTDVRRRPDRSAAESRTRPNKFYAPLTAANNDHCHIIYINNM